MREKRVLYQEWNDEKKNEKKLEISKLLHACVFITTKKNWHIGFDFYIEHTSPSSSSFIVRRTLVMAVSSSSGFCFMMMMMGKWKKNRWPSSTNKKNIPLVYIQIIWQSHYHRNHDRTAPFLLFCFCHLPLLLTIYCVCWPFVDGYKFFAKMCLCVKTYYHSS